jgi:CRP-like cAMP-binding protein
MEPQQLEAIASGVAGRLAALDMATALAWAGAGLTVIALALRGMLALRLTAVVAGAAVAAHAALTGQQALLVVATTAAVLSALRLAQALHIRRRAMRPHDPALSFEWIAQVARPYRFPAGTTLFKAGDPADYIYYLQKGEVRIVEADEIVGRGEIFGEVAFFATPRRRSATAVCETKCRIVVLDEARFMRATYENPAFGLDLLRLVAGRLAASGRRSRAAEPEKDGPEEEGPEEDGPEEDGTTGIPGS